ncbi:MAG: C10 family peptidase [Bacteroidales bacterium]|nr:C10 family peptidase [Bacteroidales bacterium]
MTKKSLFILAISFFMISFVFGKEVDKNKAKQIAKNVYIERINNNADSKTDIFSNNITITYKSKTAYYVFNIKDNKGFIIISSDDDVYPVLGYSKKGHYTEDISDKAPAFIDWMDFYKEQIYFVKENKLKGTDNVKSEWKKYSSKKFHPQKDIKDVGPLLTTEWNQDCYYNEQCPADAGGPCGHVYAGCVASAMSQVMKYHNYPEHGTGEHCYTHPVYGQLCANFGQTTYNWSDMPDQLYTNNNSIATLMYHCGVSVDMNYAPDGSGAYLQTIATSIVTYFNYCPTASYKSKYAYSATGWETLLKTELDASRPMPYRGQGTTGGHAFVCDGYEGSNHFHFNWGWSGMYNGYYYLSSLTPPGYNFTNNQAAVIGIRPPENPVADFTANKTSVPTNGSINFIDQSTEYPTSWQWTFEGGTPSTSTDKNPMNISYNTPGYYTVTLTVTNPVGTDTETKTDFITVGVPDIDFTADVTSIMVGEDVNFTDLSTGDPTAWEWSFGDGSPVSNEQNPTHTYNTYGTFNVKLTATNQWGSNHKTKTNFITVSTIPTANFTADTTYVSPEGSINYTDLSEGVPTSWQWTFEGGTPNSSTEQNPENIVYNNLGKYSVTLISTNDFGADTITKTNYITVGIAPEADFTADNTEIPANDTVSFSDASLYEPTSWQWTFEGGTPDTSTEQNPKIAYKTPGVYSVTLIAKNIFGEDTKVKTNYITVNEIPPTADFYTFNPNIPVGGSIHFINNSTGDPTSWLWTFEGGEPSTSSDENPVNIVYNYAGSYDVTLIVTNNVGSDTLLKYDYITVGNEGINDNSNSDNISIYPNPVKDKFFIKLDNSNLNINKIIITDNLGRILFNLENINEKSLSIDMSKYQKGFYFINIYTKNNIIVKKISLIK